MAAADDGPPRALRTDRPTRTTLRPTELPELAPVRVPVRSPREAIILVSGINSYPQDPTFDRLIATLWNDPRYQIYRFGADPEHPYDALGDLDVNAHNLRDEVRSIGAMHPAVHIVAHSMGGAVADRAFASGLSAGDGVVSYVALASPHNGSTALRASSGLLAVAGDDGIEIRAAFSAKLDPGSDAARGLARLRPVTPPTGVVRLDLRMSTDWTVPPRDALDPGVESRTLTPSEPHGYLDGHGDITGDPQALRLITSTIERRSVPADERSAALKQAAGRESVAAGMLASIVTAAGIALGCLILFSLFCYPGLKRWTRPIALRQLAAVRRK